MKAILTLRIVIVSFLLFFTFNFGFSQSQNLWKAAKESAIPVTGVRYISAKSYFAMQLDLNELKNILQTAPVNDLNNLKNSNFQLDLPMPDGSFQTFIISETPMMEPALAALFPEIKTYTGYGLNNDGLYLKFDVTPQGFHGMILSAGQGTVFIDPYYFGGLNAEHYIVYKKKDFQSLSDKVFSCGLTSQPDVPSTDPKMLGTCQMKTYRLALAATGEYTTFHGGTVALAQAAQVTTMNRVNGVYERDCAVHMNIIANNNLLIYTNGGTDPYTNNNGATMLTENQNNCNTVIGSANYDIGHVFSTGGGGIAQLGCVCSTSKAQGVTGSPAPIGDPFDIDYVAHEMGHQYGGNHTFHSNQGACGGNMNNATSFEPGSGSTIQAYAGICAPNDLQSNSDDYFHGISLEEIANEIASSGHTCEVVTALSNNAPNISTATATYQIPISTPFFLTCSATDADASNVLTYCWEQMNGGTLVTMPPVSTNASGPNFRSWDPTTSPTRYFPRISDLAAGTVSQWEVLPSVTRTLNFRVVVRDNAPGGGCNDHENFIVQTTSTAGPFTVTYPSATGITWNATSTQTVTWNVNNTNVAPVSCANVDILLSTDGGLTYPITILANTPNDGTQSITVPNNPSTTCRIMVRAVGNVFFDISDNNFTITAPTSDYSLSATPSSVTICPPTVASFPITVGSIGGYTTSVTLSVTGVPAGATSSFTTNPVIPGNTTTLNVNPGTAVAGTYNLTLQGNSASGTHTIPLTLIISSPTPGAVTLTAPANGATNQPTLPTFTWNAVSGTGITYAIDIATDAGFTTIVNSATGLLTNSYTPATPLATGTVHYWRVRATSGCGTGPNSSTFSFTTGTVACSTFTSTNVPITISASGTPTVTSTLNIPTMGTITDVNVVNLAGTHTYISDLTIRLTSPLGTVVTLFQNVCTNQDNWNLNLDDEATPGALPCPPTGGGTYQPNQPLSAIDGQAMNGTWTLTILDGFDQDGGSLNSWGLNICYLVPPPTCSLSVSTTPVNATCGLNNGTATANVSNSTGSVGYSWSSGATTATATGLAAGTYTVTVSDGSGCTATSTAVVGTSADVTNPVANCQNVTVYLNGAGTSTITGTTINNGSTDNCGISTYTANPTTFNCTDITYPNAQKLFISEYIEGSATNQCIEIANFTGATVNLTGYQLKIFGGGSTTATGTINLTGSVLNGDVYVVCNNTAGAGFLAVSDQNTATMNFSGDDAVVLFGPANDTLDIIGKIGCDPGTAWTAAGYSTQNRTIRRNPDIGSGVIHNPNGACTVTSFPTLSTQWANFAQDNNANLGAHTYSTLNPVVLTVTDAAGNTASCTAQVTVLDTVRPTITAPANVSVPPNSGCNATGVSLGTPTTSDNCSVASVTNNAPGSFPSGTTIVTWTVTDGSGNIKTATQTVTVTDNIAPVPNVGSLPNATGQCSVTLTAPTATDNCLGIVTGTTINPTTYNTQGTFVVTWSYTDGAGNTSTQNQTVIVDDVTNPVTPTLSNVTAQCSVTPVAPTTTDNCAGTITGTTSTTFPISTQGTTVVTWTFNDGNGNSINVNQNVIIDDVTAPVPNTGSLPTVTVDCVTPVTAPTATDNCAGTITGTTTDPVVYPTSGTYTITWTYNDGNGNTSTQTQTVIAADNVDPVVSNCPANINTVANTTGCSAVVTWSAPSATDACSSVSMTSSHNSGDTFPLGTTAVTYTFTDASGNSSVCTFNVTVTNDLSVTGTTTDEMSGNDGSIDITVSGGSSPYGVSWSSGQATQDISGLAGGTYTVTITDANGCTSTSSYTVNSHMGVNEQTEQIISIYPNPTSSYVQITSSDEVYKVFKLHNSLGQVIYTGGFNKTLSIDMTTYASGVYHLTIGNKTYKIIRR